MRLLYHIYTNIIEPLDMSGLLRFKLVTALAIYVVVLRELAVCTERLNLRLVSWSYRYCR